MGKYDDITPDRLQAEILRFAKLLLKMDEEEILLEKTPSVLRLLGELRQMLFAYEVRYTKKLMPSERPAETGSGQQDLALGDSLRIVQQALRRERELQEELERRLFRDREDDG